MGVELGVFTPSLTLPLKWGGDKFSRW